MIPDNDAFNNFLRGCHVTPSPDGTYAALANVTRLGVEGTILPGLYLQYPTTGVSLGSVVKKFRESLAGQGHVDDDLVALTTMALCVVTAESGESPAQHASQVLEAARTAELMQSIVLPGQPGAGYASDLGTYAIRSFNPEKILYW